jgi:starvation-inducible outer membrane lipoprotein
MNNVIIKSCLIAAFLALSACASTPPPVEEPSTQQQQQNAKEALDKL